MTKFINTKLLHKIGVTIKEVRIKKGLTQEDVYTDTGIHIARMETAARNLSISSLSVVTDYFEIKLSDFFKLVEKQQ
ncbi:helix-turn-helix domain-containing protein [Ferruginibacter sp. HRS2-29]|uniref:helix-turn-helix domain-containing protein n=1 Tax=Ferruginibacter sp. HRS2-29 TaxID=2487334 RepID=UPI0020CF97B4|nr:helix-turn-helix transcriptional regulator [Ferruginibacter sp. HRS2-29]MCP9752793.1 XRE family transcriptional regulator [Ferruginibacter sp. HRS2-29]